MTPFSAVISGVACVIGIGLLAMVMLAGAIAVLACAGWALVRWLERFRAC